MSSPIYCRVELRLPMTWSKTEWWLTNMLYDYLGDVYDDGDTISFNGEANYGSAGHLGDILGYLRELRVPYVLYEDGDYESTGSVEMFDGTHRMEAERADPIVMSSHLWRQITSGKHPWALTVAHYFDVAESWCGASLEIDHLQPWAPPDPADHDDRIDNTHPGEPHAH
jgi:hypothetical protein